MRRTLTIGLLALATVAVGCGDDEGSSDTTTTEAPASTTSTTTSTTASGAPSEEFCSAYRDYLGAQDGAQLNTALGTMASELPSDAPAAVSSAIQTLGTGDLAPEVTGEAGSTLEAWAGPACGSG